MATTTLFLLSVCTLCVLFLQRPQGSMEVVCEATGEWSRPVPRCVSVLCDEPPTLKDAVTVGENYELGNKVFYVCKEG